MVDRRPLSMCTCEVEGGGGDGGWRCRWRAVVEGGGGWRMVWWWRVVVVVGGGGGDGGGGGGGGEGAMAPSVSPSREPALTFASSCLTYSGSDASPQPPPQPPPPLPPPGGWREVPAAARPPSYSPAGAPRLLLPPLELCRLTSLPGSPEAHMKQLTNSSSTSALSAASPEGRLWRAGASRGGLPGDCRDRSIADSGLGSTLRSSRFP